MESGYYCEYCNFYGKTIYLLKQHLEAKKHKSLSGNNICINNYNKIIYRCSQCNKMSNNKSNMFRHAKKCTKNDVNRDITSDCIDENDSTYNVIKLAMTINDEDTKMKIIKMFLDEKAKSQARELDDTAKLKSKELELTSKMKDIYENENEFHKKVAVNAGQIVNKTMNMLTYAVQNLKETPKLEMLDSKTARNLLKYESENGCLKKDLDNDKIAEYIAKMSEAKILPKHLGNTLVSYYKRDDPNHQSLWTTDVNRMKFITRTNDGWLKDANGDIINRNMIIPLLKEVSKIMDEYCSEKIKRIDKMSGIEEAKYVEVSEQRINIKSDIITKRLNKSIIKHIAPYFIMQKQFKQLI
jgi:hypothetical protein